MRWTLPGSAFAGRLLFIAFAVLAALPTLAVMPAAPDERLKGIKEMAVVLDIPNDLYLLPSRASSTNRTMITTNALYIAAVDRLTKGGIKVVDRSHTTMKIHAKVMFHGASNQEPVVQVRVEVSDNALLARNKQMTERIDIFGMGVSGPPEMVAYALVFIDEFVRKWQHANGKLLLPESMRTILDTE